MRIWAIWAVLLSLVFANIDYYKILGVSKSASEKEIKQGYRREAKANHPDKNPNDGKAHERFVQITEAYEVLSDKEQRNIYDKFGHEGLKRNQGQQQHHDPFEVFSRFFGGGGHFYQGVKRGPNMEIELSVSLKDLYLGTPLEFGIEKQGICEKCSGSGSHDGKKHTCKSCEGRGMKLVKHMIAPGFFQQMQVPCEDCRGTGSKIKNPCKVCSGNGVVRTNVQYSLPVQRGWTRGSKIAFENEADDSPDWIAGDLIVNIAERLDVDTLGFRRKGKDLFYTQVLSIQEALLGGWTKNLKHFDGHNITLTKEIGQVVQPNSIEVLEGEGMPIVDTEKFGNLIVDYQIIIPESFPAAFTKDLKALFMKYKIPLRDEL